MSMISDREISYSNSGNGFAERESISEPYDGSADTVGALWRYRWAVLVLAVAGCAIGFLIYLRTPETYRSTTRLMLETDNPVVLESTTGDWRGGVSSIEVVRAQLFSDSVVSMAFDSAPLQSFRHDFSDSSSNFAARAQGALKLKPEAEDIRTGQSLVALLHYEGTDPALCKAAVQSFSDALLAFFNERQRSSRGELIELIRTAMDQLLPEMLELEQGYRDFRREAPLAWDADGNAINPHRERQLFLVQKRSELIEEQRHAAIELASIESIVQESADDPIAALSIIGELLGKEFDLFTDKQMRENLLQGDQQLAQIGFDQSLVPLMIERNRVVAEFGANHPTVKALDSDLATMKNELKRLVEKEASRIVELVAAGKTEKLDPVARARKAAGVVVFAAKAKGRLLKQQLEGIETQIADENLAAAKLAQFEHEDQSHLRKIDRTRELLDKLEEQMARVSLIEDEGGTRVIELTAPSMAYRIGPDLGKNLGIGTLIGFALGASLALLLEKNANTFRDPDEISDILGVPILTHLPFFKGRARKKGEDADPFANFDPHLSVIHQPASVPAEAIRSLRTSVMFEFAGSAGAVIQVTSPLPGDGKTTIAGNLACSLAQSGKKVLIIDCDLRRPMISENFMLSDQHGLTNVLNGDCELCEAIHRIPIGTLEVMPSGPVAKNPAEALTLPEMAELLEVLRDKYDYVVMDTPPLLVVTDPSITASMVDGVVMALRIRRKSKPNAKESVNILKAVGAKMLGVVINNSDEAGISDGYRGYSYYRYGRYTSRYKTDSKNGKNGNGLRRRSPSLLVSGRNGKNGVELKTAERGLTSLDDSR